MLAERGGSPTLGVGGRHVHEKSLWNLYSGLKINAKRVGLRPGRRGGQIYRIRRIICDFRHPLTHLAPRPHLCTTSCFHTSPQCISRSVCSATHPCQECGNHTTELDQSEVFTKFMKPLKLDETFDLKVSGSYWTLWRPSCVQLLSCAHESCGGGERRKFQKAQVLVFQPKWQGDGTISPVTFVNLHLPSSDKRKLTMENRKHHFRAAIALAGGNGIIMGDLNTRNQDRRPLPRQRKSSF